MIFENLFKKKTKYEPTGPLHLSSDTHMMIIFEPVFKWEVVRSAIQACLEQDIPFSKCHRRASSGALVNGRFGMCGIEN